MLTRYRAAGAELPRSDLRRGGRRGMDGYFWRFSDPDSGRVIIALCGVCRDRDGGSWANVAVAATPGDFLREADLMSAGTATDRFSVWAGPDDPRLRDGVDVLRDGADELRADADALSVTLGGDTRLEVSLSERRDWVRPWLGGIGVAQLLPGLGQYWHPHLLGAEVRGTATLGGASVCLDGWRAYGEHNWGSGGFPPRWWWGQAQGFDDDDVCVAFAGGDVRIGPGHLQATGVVVRRGSTLLRLGNPLLAPVRVEADGSRWEVRGRGPLWSVELEGEASGEPHVLPIPLPGERRSVSGAHEHLAAHLSLTVRRRGEIVYCGRSAVAGLEVGSLAETGPGAPAQ